MRKEGIEKLVRLVHNPPQIEVLNKHLFLTAKPVIYLVNLSEKDYMRKKNKWYNNTIHNITTILHACVYISVASNGVWWRPQAPDTLVP